MFSIHSPQSHLGIIFSKKGEYPTAIEEYKKALQFDPSMPEALLNLGSAYQTMGNLRLAQSCFRSYLELPNAPEKEVVERLLNAVSRTGATETTSREDNSSDYLVHVVSRGIGIWPKERMPLRVFIARGDGITGFSPDYADKLCEAFDDWARVSQGRLSWRKVSNVDSADVVCGWTADSAELGESGVEGGSSSLKFWPGDGVNAIISSQILLLTHELDSVKEVAPASMKRRCLHEVGHTLGLSGHSPDNKDVMFFTEVESIGLSPSNRDVSTLLKLYKMGWGKSARDFPDTGKRMAPKSGNSYVTPANNLRPQRMPQPNNGFDWRNQVRQNLREDRVNLPSGIFVPSLRLR